jgi:hypothetical protein
MANIKGIELASEVYDLEDETARSTATTAGQTASQASETATQASETATQASQTATQASQTATQADSKIGDLADLETTAKTDLVSAINEVAAKDPSARLTCGYYQVQIPAGEETSISNPQLAILIGKGLSLLTVGQGILFQGVAQRANATECLPLSIFLEKTASGFSNHEALDGTGISVYTFPTSGATAFTNSSDSAVTLFLNVVGINASIITE